MSLRERDWEQVKPKVIAIALAVYTKITGKKTEINVDVSHHDEEHRITVTFPVTSFTSTNQAMEVIWAMNREVEAKAHLFPDHGIQEDDFVGYSYEWDDEIEGELNRDLGGREGRI